MKIIVAVLLLVVSVTAQDQCSDNLVQALQTCASSISANEPLSAQQTKCSPTGCNYDQPSVDLINSLRSDMMSMFKSANSTIAQLQGTITQLQGMVDTNTNGIASNANGIASNAVNIATLQDKVDPLGFPCGSAGWTRIAFLDMSDPSQNCPDGFRLYDQDGVRACGRAENGGASCDSVTFPIDISYSEVCGRVYGFQYASPDGINPAHGPGHDDLESTYLDGISLTYGSPRTHIWSFIATVFETVTGASTCPCNTGSTVTTQSFIGDDYFCEAGSNQGWSQVLYSDDVLWDGKGCRDDEGPCCDKPGIPWFQKVFESETTEDIELRVCSEQSTNDEDTPITFYELYVR